MKLPEISYGKTEISAAAVISILYASAAYFYRYGFESSFLILAVMFAARAVIVFAAVLRIVLPGMHLLATRAFSKEAGRDRPLWRIVLLFALIWLPFLLIKFPASIHPDTWQGIWQFRHGEMIVHQPVFFVVLVGEFMERFSPSAGIFLVALLEYILYSFAFGYALTYADSLGINKKIRYITIFLLGFSPFTLGYIGVVVKDEFFAAGMIIFVVTLMELSRQKTLPLSKLILLFFSSMMIFLFRPNGAYILIAVALACIISAVRGKSGARPAIPVITAIILCYVINSALISAYNVKRPDNYIKEALSVPFQQTARYAVDHPDDITPEEKDIIDRIIPYDIMISVYDPRISDPVKENYTGNNNLLPDYFGVWFKQLCRHPESYINAFGEQNYYLLNPASSTQNIAFFEDTTVYYELDYKYDCKGSWMYEPIVDSPEFLTITREALTAYCFAVINIPFVWITSNNGLCVLLFVLLSLLSLKNPQKRSLICYLPLWLTIFFILAGPVVQGQPRYTLPILYLIPVLLWDYLSVIRDSSDL